MPKDFSRTRRVADLIQRELARLIPQEVNDPRVAPVTVSAVRVSRDLAHARVFVTTLEGEAASRETVAALNRAAGFLRHLLAQEVRLRTTPELRFEYDTAVERGARLSALIDEAVARDRDERKDEE